MTLESEEFYSILTNSIAFLVLVRLLTNFWSIATTVNSAVDLGIVSTVSNISLNAASKAFRNIAH